MNSLLSRPLSLLLLRPANTALVVTPVRGHTGYIDFQGRLGNRDDRKVRLQQQTGLLNLEPVKRVAFRLDPFAPDAQGIRTFMWAISKQKTRATNPKCVVKTEIVSDGSPQQIKFEFNDALERKPVLFKAGTMDGLEMLFEFNKLVLPLVKVTEEAELAALAEKKRYQEARLSWRTETLPGFKYRNARLPPKPKQPKGQQ